MQKIRDVDDLIYVIKILLYKTKLANWDINQKLPLHLDPTVASCSNKLLARFVEVRIVRYVHVNESIRVNYRALTL